MISSPLYSGLENLTVGQSSPLASPQHSGRTEVIGPSPEVAMIDQAQKEFSSQNQVSSPYSSSPGGSIVSEDI